ncbi:MAG: hypothetical protein CMJ32_04605 [Phycisphaerae bacterium]|nr:hypothetical protein [Phycisphaerae bacterium]
MIRGLFEGEPFPDLDDRAVVRDGADQHARKMLVDVVDLLAGEGLGKARRWRQADAGQQDRG